VTSWVSPCREIIDTSIAALPESFGSLSYLGSLCVRWAPARVAPALMPRREWEWESGCKGIRRGTRSDACVRRRWFDRAARSRTLRSPRCPSRSAACPISAHCASGGHLRAWLRHLRVPCMLESAGLWLDAVSARDRMRLCYVMGSAAQGDLEHFDRRAARVVRQPVQSRLTVRPPGSCVRGFGTCASAAL
jgi:hypothetical protein